jgi:hypothetical protein
LAVGWLNDHAAAWAPATFNVDACDVLIDGPHLLVLGMRRDGSGRKSLGPINRKLATGATCALMLLSRRMPVVSVTGVTRPLRDVAQFVPFLPRRPVDD